ncbi:MULTISPECIES: type I-E CRISPR-associated protein Cse2/CasB [unclassified Streptomyces]|uniref:type I-E CRISPR-associated protein Cse2/CasB n=1 Tax=unclassified Streptomyces TaxID=2593676 RepID=UPI001660D8D2|nr:MULTISPECIES: type I-E CRISPR-associated protein Cse2/CasB [unclassified Streptomyces]MBD0708219.1 type I-E CRISPR-associated protein Cse2/CasB [Streptomyces sp. CBMA291]MBD0717788.1 type I-E CRISPR-associated protein Cse2/CasB [Streptomyces sp. CBMA370]
MASHTTAPPPPGDPARPLPPLPGRAVSRVVGKLQAGYQEDDSWAVSSVARLRREAGKDAHLSPSAWGLDHLETLAYLREERQMREEEARGPGLVDAALLSSPGYRAREIQEQREDTAVHLAVTLWALHQQSLRNDAMHRRGWPLGRAVRRLATGGTGAQDAPSSKSTSGGSPSTGPEAQGTEEISETVRRRFVRVGSASDVDVLATRLRELVLLLRSARIPLDYALLADQLLRWQDEERRDTVRRTWGRDFHRRYRSAAEASGDVEDGTAGPSELRGDDEAPDMEEFDGDS